MAHGIKEGSQHVDAQTVARQLSEHGFAVIDRLVGRDEVSALAAACDEIIDRQVEAAGDRMLGGITRQVMGPSNAHPRFDQNEALAQAKEAATVFFGGAVDRTFDMLINKPPGHPYETPWHQDYAYGGAPVQPAGSRPTRETIQVWVALDDVDEENGCMQFVPGHHDKPMIEHYVASGAPTDPGRLLAMVAPEQHLDLRRRVVAAIPAGGCTMHLSCTPHYTGPNTSKSRGRRAYIFNLARIE